MSMKTRRLVVFTGALVTGAAALAFSPALAAAEGCTITCEHCYIDNVTHTAQCDHCTFQCPTTLQ